MEKDTIQLKVAKSVKEKAEHFAELRVISLSDYFEQIVLREIEYESNVDLESDTAKAILDLVPDSESIKDYDYDELKKDALMDKYGL